MLDDLLFPLDSGNCLRSVQERKPLRARPWKQPEECGHSRGLSEVYGAMQTAFRPGPPAIHSADSIVDFIEICLGFEAGRKLVAASCSGLIERF